MKKSRENGWKCLPNTQTCVRVHKVIFAVGGRQSEEEGSVRKRGERGGIIEDRKHDILGAS